MWGLQCVSTRQEGWGIHVPSWMVAEHPRTWQAEGHPTWRLVEGHPTWGQGEGHPKVLLEELGGVRHRQKVNNIPKYMPRGGGAPQSSPAGGTVCVRTRMW